MEITKNNNVPLTVVFVRHAQAEKHSIDKELGPPLTPLGKRQAERVAERLKNDKFDHIYTSNMSRAYETAQAIIKFHKETICTVVRNLREVTSYHFTPGMNPDTSEMIKCVCDERDALERFANQLRHAHRQGEKVLVVCHGNFIRTIMPILAGRNPEESLLIDINNTAITILEVWTSGEAILRLGNCVKHLLPGLIS